MASPQNHFADPRQFVKVVNRTSKPLKVTFDGRSAIIDPYPGYLFMTGMAADKALGQNRRMGTEDPLDPREFVSLLGVEGWERFPVDPIEQSQEIESLDRRLLPPEAQKAVKVPTRAAKRIDRARTTGDHAEVQAFGEG
jgi:hypothetical protein